MTIESTRVSPSAADRAFRSFQRSRNPNALAEVFDAAAGDLRRVARHVVNTQATVDDLVQATFLIAIEQAHSFDTKRPVLPWLTGILRNQAKLVHRRERRRVDPDRLPEPEDLDPVRSAEDREFDAQVDRAITKLGPSYRPVLNLYLKHGLGAGEIAETLGRPAGTVRTQIVRGLEQVREHLPVALSGLIAGLLPSAGSAAVRATVLEHASKASSAKVATAASIAISKFWVSIAVALLVLGFSSWAVVDSLSSATDASTRTGVVAGGSDDSDASTLGGASDSGADTASAAAEFADSATDRPDRRTVSTEGTEANPGAITARIRGVVRDTDGDAVAGASVLLWSDGRRAGARRDGEFVVQPVTTATTGDGGAFEIGTPSEEFTLTAQHGQLWCVERVTGSVANREVIDGVTLTIAPTVILEGSLLDSSGDGIADFEIESDGSLRAAEPTDVPDVFNSHADAIACRTDANGTFRLRAVADHRYPWSIDHPEHLGFSTRHAPAEGRLDIRLESGATIHGQVFRADGTPANGAKVRLSARWWRRGVCDPHGRFEIRGAEIDPRNSFLLVHDDASAVFAHQPIPDDLSNVILHLEAPQRIAGVAIDAEGRPIAGATVRVIGDRRVVSNTSYGEPRTWEFLSGKSRCTTDEDGRFSFDHLYRGEFEVGLMSHIDIGHSVSVRTSAGDEDLVLRFDPSATPSVSIRGNVRDALTGEPLAGARLLVSRPNVNHTGTIGRHHELEHSEFDLGHVLAGEIAFSAHYPGYAQWKRPLTHVASGTLELEVRLYPERHVDLEVRDASGKPPRRARVKALAPDRSYEIYFPSGQGASTNTKQLQRGDVRLEGLPAHEVILVVFVQGEDEPHEHHVDLRQQPLDPIRLEIGNPTEIGTLTFGIMGCGASADVREFEGALELDDYREMFRLPDVWPIDATVEFTVRRTSNSRRIATAKLTPVRESDQPFGGRPVFSYKTETSELFRSTGSSGSGPATPLATIHFDVQVADLELTITADGYETRTLSLTERQVREHAVAEQRRTPRAPQVLFLRKSR